MPTLDVLNESTHEPIVNSVEYPGAERNVLAYVLHKPDAIFDATTKLREGDFNNSLNQKIYTVMCRLSEKGVPISTENILAVTRTNSALDKNGEEYLHRISLTDATRIDLEYNINLVQAASVRRAAYREALHVMKDSVNDSFVDANSFLGTQQKRFVDLGMDVTNDGVVHMGEGLREWIRERKENPNPTPGLSTGFKALDKAIGGWMDGRLYTIAARSKSRKSILLNNFAAHVAYRLNEPILYLDTEMQSFDDVRPRLIAIVSGVSEVKITTGTFVYNPEEVEAVEKAIEIIENGPFYHRYCPGFSVTEIASVIRKHRLKHGVKAVFFDYVKMPMNGDTKNMQEHQLLGNLTAMLKDVCGELSVPCLTAAQMNRSGIKKEEDEADDFDSGMIAASDRILHNTSYLFYLAKKTPKQIAQDGNDMGNMVLVLGESRHGGGEYKAFLNAHPTNARIAEILNILD